MEIKSDQQAGIESKPRLVEQVNHYLHSGDYSRALDLLRGATADFPNDAEICRLEQLAHDGVKRNAEANRLITESQELFAQQKAAEAIQLLRRAYELDKSNTLARAILANALVEHAHSFAENDWLHAETLTNQALALNPAHPTAKTILNLIVEKKTKSSAEDWVLQAGKLQSSGDLFAALAWVAEGLAVHPHDSRLLQIQDAIQRDQESRRRQTRRRDLQDLRRLESEIDGPADVAAKKALAERIQAVAAKYWTDGEILSLANGLLQRLGLVSGESSTASLGSKSATVIFHVPRTSTPKPSSAHISQIPPAKVAPGGAPASSATPQVAEIKTPQIEIAKTKAPQVEIPQSTVPQGAIAGENSSIGAVPPSKVPLRTRPRGKLRTALPKMQFSSSPAITVPAAETFVTAAKFTAPPSREKQAPKSNSTTLVLTTAIIATVMLFAAFFFFARKHPAQKALNTPAATPAASASVAVSPAVSIPARTTLQPSHPDLPVSSETGSGEATSDDQPRSIAGPRSKMTTGTDSGHNVGTLVILTGQDNVKVFLNGKLQEPLTQAGQLRIPNLELKDYVVQVSKSGFQDPPQQEVRIRKGEPAKLIFNLQPQPQPQSQPRLASLTIHDGAPGAIVLLDQTLVGTIQANGTLSVSIINPGDHTVELRKERFKTRQFKEHFVAGGAISLTGADAALEAAPGELKIVFAPADARVAIVKGDLLTMVSSGIPLNLAAGTYTLTARSADGFTSSSKVEVIAGQSKTLNLSLAPSGMSKWDDPSAWRQEKDSFVRKGGDFVLYGVAPSSGTFVFSAMPAKGHLLQWVLNYSDPKNYVLFQMDDNYFYRSVIRNGVKTDEVRVPDKSDRKSFRTIHIHVSSTELVHEVKNGDSWIIVDRWTQPGANLGLGKFGFYIPGNDQVALSSFAHYADLNIR